MEISNYIALGGLERIVIIGAATLIGYWGYRIFGRSQLSGLSLIIAATGVLLASLLTAEQHLQSVNANLLASTAPAAEPVVAEPPHSNQPLPNSRESAVSSGDEVSLTEPTETSAIAAETASPGAAVESDPEPKQPTAEDTPRPLPLATGQELGGRITSIRSENVTLEWSPEVQRRRIISSSGQSARAP